MVKGHVRESLGAGTYRRERAKEPALNPAGTWQQASRTVWFSRLAHAALLCGSERRKALKKKETTEP